MYSSAISMMRQMHVKRMSPEDFVPLSLCAYYHITLTCTGLVCYMYMHTGFLDAMGLWQLLLLPMRQSDSECDNGMALLKHI